jgi:glycosyltransferase involved in cell wall biosynthesis
MNVVIVDGDVSYPANSGKRLRTLHLMLRLAGRHRLTYVARNHGRPEEAVAARAYLREHGIASVILDDPIPPKKGAGFYARLAANLLSPLPYSVASHQSRRMAGALQEIAANQKVDLWQVEWSGYLSAVPEGGAPRLLMAPNVDTLIWQRYHEAERGAAKHWYVKQQWRKFERFEQWAFRSASRVVACTAEDAVLIRERFGGRDVEVVDNGVDVGSFEGVRRAPDGQRILYLGSLDWRPNLDALRVLLDNTFPAVRRQEPGARLDIVGRSPPAWLVERARTSPGVELHADVPDVRPYLARSAVLAVPLRIGGGSRLKILEALACGVPVVSTRVGAEGLCLRPGEDYLLVERVEDMAGPLLDCLRRPEWAAQLGASGREVVRQRYDWGALADKLERVWERCWSGRGAAEVQHA